jgi:hypothetical protein
MERDMKKIVYVSDFFYPELLGGAEQSDHELLNILKEENDVLTFKSSNLKIQDIKNNKGCLWIISNYINIGTLLKEIIENIDDFTVWEHDHKYLANRDPSPYDDYIAPKDQLVNVELYQNAKYIVVQSNLHNEIINKNLDNINTFVVGGNLWTEDLLDKIESLSDPPKNGIASIMVSNIKHKNTAGAIKYCQYVERDYELISTVAPEMFFEMISKNEYFVFLPKTVETLSRIVVEAKMLGCKVITNNKIGATSEDWFKDLSGQDLIDYMRNEKKEHVRQFIRELL